MPVAHQGAAVRVAAATWLVAGVLLLIPGSTFAPLVEWGARVFGWQEGTSSPCAGLLCIDKLVHVLIFAVVAWVSARIDPSSWRRQIGAALAVFAYGLFLELLQGWSGWRDADILDGLCNGLGSALGVVMGRRLGWFR